MSTESDACFLLALGALARYPQLISGCGLEVDDFPEGPQRSIFAASRSCDTEQETGALDLGSLAIISGSELAIDLPFAPNPEAAHRRIAKARQYAVHAACAVALRPILAAVAAGETPATTMLGSMSRLVETMREKHGSSIRPLSAAEIVKRWLDAEQQIERAATDGYPMGLPTLDRCLGKVHPGECMVIASRPGEGKSTLAMQVAEHWSEQGMIGVYFSAEMSCEDLGERLAHRLAKRSTLNRLSPKERDEVSAILPGLHRLSRIKVCDSRRISMDEVRRLLATEILRGAGYFVIDNLKHVDSHTAERDVDRFARTVRELRQCAGEHSIPVVILHHLSRRAEYAEQNDEDPSSAWLKGSGGIEEEADIVIFLQALKNDAMAGTDIDGKADAIIIKSRRTGAHGIKVALSFDKRSQHFSEVANGDN